uniref:ORF1 protein n=1 Tax=Agrobacterium tumefaciens TaxID=358 RepID=O31245_AGRTU|nr:ORF1 [Agrobacterium tumefaciens]
MAEVSGKSLLSGASAQHGVCANQFQISGLSQSTVSSHLAVLQAAGLIRSKKVGQWVFFERNEETIDAFRNYLQTNL